MLARKLPLAMKVAVTGSAASILGCDRPAEQDFIGAPKYPVLAYLDLFSSLADWCNSSYAGAVLAAPRKRRARPSVAWSLPERLVRVTDKTKEASWG